LAEQAGFADRISFREGHAEAIPLLAELVRVTRPGGRIAAIVRSLDMPPWTNAALSPAVRAKADAPGRGDVAPAGCADASLYERFRRAGLVGLTCFSQLASVFKGAPVTEGVRRAQSALTPFAVVGHPT
jgi:hypothetical protein